jgi:hypothetical protein
MGRRADPRETGYVSDNHMVLAKVVSGGQTGADRAALDAARSAGVAIGGWIPLGRWAEDGPIPSDLAELRETTSRDPGERTVLNVLDSDGTLIVSHGELRGGSALTRAAAVRHGRPWLWLDLAEEPLESAPSRASAWIAEHEIRVLNVAGPRASEDARIYDATLALVTALLPRSR